MILKQGDILNIKDTDYLVVETSRYEEIDYALANKLDEKEDFTKEYVILEQKGYNFEIVEEQKLIELLLPIFQNKIQQDANNAKNKEKYEI